MNNKLRGFSLIEMMVAMVIFATAGLTCLALDIRSQQQLRSNTQLFIEQKQITHFHEIVSQQPMSSALLQQWQKDNQLLLPEVNFQYQKITHNIYSLRICRKNSACKDIEFQA
jgi:prepilin-type N-terminal cleavage/methylation domain-containing protein